MAERPILFSAPMVRAILAGTKTQTRRFLKQAVGPSLSVGIEDEPGVAELSWLHGDGPGHEVHETIKRVPCPYGQLGDRLWVRETWAYGIHAMAAARDEDGPFVYAATDSVQGRLCERWRPSIHMPRSASRITLEITGVRVERLQEISQADAEAEGVIEWSWGALSPESHEYMLPASKFEMLWESINGAGSWDANPWVWVVEFKRGNEK